MDRAVPPFFLLGFARSGTKMLRELLNASPEVWISDIESHFVLKFTRTIATFGDLHDRANFGRLADAVGRTRAFYWRARHGVQVDAARWYDLCRSHDWPGVLEGLYHAVWEQEIPDRGMRWECVLWGDKTPTFMMEVPLLAGLFPAARFIHIVRDPRDCALSAQAAWGNTPVRTAQLWADRTQRCRAAGAALGPARFREIRYEDLVRDVHTGLAGLFDFLGVPTPPDAGRLFRVPENLGAALGADQVVAGNVEKWTRQMEPRLRRRIERITGDLLTAYGYEREHPDLPIRPLSRPHMLALRVQDGWQQLAFRRRELGSWREAVRFLTAR